MRFIPKNSSFFDIFKIGTGNFIGNIISSLFWIFLAGLIGQENYGNLGYFLGLIGIFTVVSMIGGQYAMQVYTSKNIRIESALYVISLISGFVVSIILLILFNNSGLSISIFGFTLLNFYFSELIGKKLFSKYSIIYVLQKILFVILSLILYFLIGIEGILLGYGLSSLIFIPHLISILKSEKIHFNHIKEKKKILIYNYISELSATSRNNIDKIIILPLFGSALLGNYFLSLQIFSLMIIVPSIVQKYVISMDSQNLSTTSIKIITILFSFAITLFGIFIVPILIPYLFPKFIDAIILIPIISVAVLPRTISIMIMSSLISNEKNIHVTIGNSISLVSLIFGIVISFNFLNDIGIAISFTIASILNCIYLIIYKKYFY